MLVANCETVQYPRKYVLIKECIRTHQTCKRIGKLFQVVWNAWLWNSGVHCGANGDGTAYKLVRLHDEQLKKNNCTNIGIDNDVDNLTLEEQ